MSISPFPHTYSVTLTNNALMAEPRDPIRMGPPPQFDGTNDVWSPEHLLVASLLSCVKTTFDAYARRDGITVHQWQGNATAVLAKSPQGPIFTSIDVEIEIATEVGQESRVQAVVAATERNCIVSRALSAPVHVIGKVTSTANRAVG